MGVVVRRYIDILTIIINFPYSTCISSFLAASLLLCSFFKCFFGLLNLVPLFSLFLTVLLVKPDRNLILSINDINVTAQIVSDNVIPWQQYPITLVEINSNQQRGKILLAHLDIVIAPLEGKEGCACVCVFASVVFTSYY